MLTPELGADMRRREFISLLGGAAAAWPLAARAQQLTKLPRIGFLQRVRNENVVAFIQALRDAGYVDGQNAVIETRIFETALDRVPRSRQRTCRSQVRCHPRRVAICVRSCNESDNYDPHRWN